MGQNGSVPRGQDSNRRRVTWRTSRFMQGSRSANSDRPLHEVRPAFTTRHTVQMSYSRREPSQHREESWFDAAAPINNVPTGEGPFSTETDQSMELGLEHSHLGGHSLSVDSASSLQSVLPTTTITAQSIPARQSLLSRTRSRLSRSRHVGNTPGYGMRIGSSQDITSIPQSRRPLSFLASSSRSRRSRLGERRNGLASISRPIPYLPQQWPSDGEPESGPAEALRSLERPSSPVRSALRDDNFPRRSSRLSRFRESLSARFQETFPSSSNTQPEDIRVSPTTSTRSVSQNDTLPVLPSDENRQNMPATRRALHGGQRSHQGSNTSAMPSTSNLYPNLDDNLNFSPVRRTDHARSISGTINRMQFPTQEPSAIHNAPGRHPSRLRRGEDQAAMLSRLLRVAAAATAQSLVGNTDRLYEARDVANDGMGGGFDGFIHALENGGLASHLRNGGSGIGSQSSTASDGTLAPVNFFRMFRFGVPENGSRSSGSATPASHLQAHEDHGSVDSDLESGEGADSRMVPIIIVGIRSVSPSGGMEGDGGSMTPPILDALTNLPMPLDLDRVSGSGGALRRSEGGVSRAYSQRRTASMGPFNSFPANYDSQRHQRMHNTGSQQENIQSPNAPITLSETPPGPHPPPSTPAEPGLSAYSSGATTPSPRPSSSSAAFPSNSPVYNHTRRSSIAGLEPTAEGDAQELNTARPRRLSDSDFSRHRTFGSGAARRNGVVEPDRRASEGTRSWIIYVLGGSYPENHPILTTPSLFTDSPSYEDMLMLSSIIGTAKAPVATQQDIAAARGLFRIGGTGAVLVADGINESSRFGIAPDDRCSVCLVEYTLGEEVRRLKRCQHMYHRECIDEWLTTCRNSCPMCRRRGVGDDPDESQHTTSEASVL